jgi:Family of unknown function (DUF6876)
LGFCVPGSLFYSIIIMEIFQIQRALKHFTGTESYHKHLFPGKSAILLSDGCDFIRTHCNAHWLFDAILSYQLEKVLKGINFQLVELRQSKKNLSWLLTFREDSNLKPLISQVIEFSDFPLDYLKLYVIDGICLLPSEN